MFCSLRTTGAVHDPGTDGRSRAAADGGALRAELPAVAERTVAAVVVEVPSYADAFSGEMGATIEPAVQLALGGFLELAVASGGATPSTPSAPRSRGPTRSAAARRASGRSMDALLGRLPGRGAGGVAGHGRGRRPQRADRRESLA